MYSKKSWSKYKVKKNYNIHPVAKCGGWFLITIIITLLQTLLLGVIVSSKKKCNKMITNNFPFAKNALMFYLPNILT